MKQLTIKNASLLAVATASLATIATFSKSFVPFYLFGSSQIFLVSCLFGTILVIASRRELLTNATYATDVIILIGLLYSTVVACFFIYSFRMVPTTYLLGILILHAIFVTFGFAAARALRAVYAILLVQAAIVLIYIVQYAIRFGDPMRGGFLQDVFASGNDRYIAFHNNIGTALGIAALAGLGITSGRSKLLVLALIPFVLWFQFHIASRTSIAALACGLAFLAAAEISIRSKRRAFVGLIALTISGISAAGFFYWYALQDRNVSPVSPDAISRTIREIQSDNPGFRLQIWSRTWQRIATEPNRLPLGRGVGAYPLDEGHGAPDWLLRKTEAAGFYPHNIHLELLYETGIAGFATFTALALLPLLFSFKQWDKLSEAERAAVALYVFYLTSIQVSGSFAYSYDFQFFFGLVAGVVALKRLELGENGGVAMRSSTSILPEIEKSPT
jgi:O-antigen ligase